MHDSLLLLTRHYHWRGGNDCTTQCLQGALSLSLSLSYTQAHTFSLSQAHSLTPSSRFPSPMCFCCEYMSWAGLGWEFLFGQLFHTLIRSSPSVVPQDKNRVLNVLKIRVPDPLTSAGLRPAAWHCATAGDRRLAACRCQPYAQFVTADRRRAAAATVISAVPRGFGCQLP